MNTEGISSLVVVDNHSNVIGNISTTDVKVCRLNIWKDTKPNNNDLAFDPLILSTSPPKHLHTLHLRDFIYSGIDRGPRLLSSLPCQPNIYTGPHSSKDCCDKISSVSTFNRDISNSNANHDSLWVTDPLSPSSSGPPTPSHSSAHIPLATPSSAASGSNIGISPPASPLPPAATSVQTPSHATPHLPTPPHLYGNAGASTGATPPLAPSVPAAALPGARLSGRLVGVVSLTDILNLHARASGLSPADPAEFRRRRRSSSSSMSVRRSGEIGREMFSRGI